MVSNLKKQFSNYFKKRKLILLITFTYTAIVLLVLLHRFWQYEAFYYDHGMMEGTAWQVSRFKLPFHHREYGKVINYVDHLYPSLQLVLAPFYWLFPFYETPIIVMSLLIGLSVLAAWEIADHLIENKLMAYTLLFAYLGYIGLQNALIFLIHDITLQIPFLMLLFLSLIKDKKRWFYLLLFINLGFKESVAISTLTLGISLLFFYKKKWRRDALAIILISIAYGWLAAKIIVPYCRQISFHKPEKFAYSPELPTNPLNYLTYFLDTPQKRETIFVSLATFGFLPLFSVFSLPLILQDFAQRFVLLAPHSPLRQGLNLHYNANLAVLLFIGSVWAVSWLEKKKIYRKLINLHALLIIAMTVFFHQFVYHGPLGLIYNPDFFKITRQMKFMDEFVAKIPQQGKIMTQNNLAVRFTHQDLYLLLSEKILRRVQPDVIAFDFRPGQNINNFWPMTEKELQDLAETLLKDKQYTPIYKEDCRYIFVKK